MGCSNIGSKYLIELTFHEEFRNAIPDNVWRTRMIEKSQGSVDACPDDRSCDALLLVPSNCLTNVLAVVHRDLQEVIEKSSNQNLAVVQLSVTVTGSIEAKVIVDFQIEQH